ncbi:hypothetical protein LR021_05395 [Candidatus Bipolaricaulota bacterium]|nr:hypothetical protein [Candidatus Bipolaricaulota bacterium]HBR09813.1 hypothetical protein [Candidatus Acetothermia bacterium]
MSKEIKKLKREFDVPWITDDGYFDPSKFPVDTVLKQTLSKDYEQFWNGCRMMQTIYQSDRPEAGVYLLGLLHHYRNDLERLVVVVETLRGFHTIECADALFSELLRIKSSNTTRKYLRMVIATLSSFPDGMVEEGFQRLAEDKSFSYRMRKKFRDILEMKRYRSLGY